MTQLSFQKQAGIYVAEVVVGNDYNLHIECDKKSTIIVSQRTAGNKFALVNYERHADVIDDDFDGIIYPKAVQVTSTEPVALGFITEKE